MKAKEKRMIAILVLITIVMFVISIIVKNSNGKQESQMQENRNSLIKEENGTKQSISNKLKETKKLENMDVTDITITEINGEATIKANITNTTNSNKKEFSITIIMLNEQGEVLEKVGGFVGNLKVGETRGIHASTNMSIDSIYDIRIEKK